ncbi:tRNA (adenine(22)-N(1))-methyltransferase [Granulicatella adiacens]
MIELGERLTRVASFVPNRSKVCDVGSDHAYLPVYLIQNNQITSAIAGEVVEGPFLSAKQTVRDYRMEERIDVRFGDGLQILSKEDEITAVTICGMGGELISRILEAGFSGGHLNGKERLILQPNVAEHFVREWLMNHSYRITNETVVEDNHRLYEIIVAEPIEERVEYTELEIKYGPILLKEPSELSVAKWTRMNRKNKEILEQLQKSKTPQHEKIEQFEKAFNELQGVIDRANS